MTKNKILKRENKRLPCGKAETSVACCLNLKCEFKAATEISLVPSLRPILEGMVLVVCSLSLWFPLHRGNEL